MELHRYDIIEAELDYGNGSIQRKRRPYIIVSNEKGTTNATIITVMPLTSVKKEKTSSTRMFRSSFWNRTYKIFYDFRWATTNNL